MPGFPVHHQFLELAQTHVHRAGDTIQPSHPLAPLLFLPSVLPSIRVFSMESVLCIRWWKYWSFIFSISPMLPYFFYEAASESSLSWFRVFLSSVQPLSHVRLFLTPWTTAHQAFLSITNSRSLLKLMSIESVMPSSHLILCCPLLFLPPIPPSIRVFSNESTLHMRWPKCWSFSFSISPSNEYSGLISFRMDWLDLLAVQGTLKSHLQYHSSKASSLRCSAFFTVQLTSIHDHGKHHSLD